MSILLELAERCEKAVGPDRELSLAIAEAVGVEGFWQPYTSSLDMALTLLPDGAFWRVGHDGEGPDPALFKAQVVATNPVASRPCDTAALALCAAALRARTKAADANDLEKTPANPHGTVG